MHKKLLITLLLSTSLLFAVALPSIATDEYMYESYWDSDEEQERIKKHQDKVRREDDTLFLKTETNAEVILKNFPVCDTINACHQVFIDYIEDKGFYLIFSYYGEGSTFALISSKDGRKFYTYNKPIFSPDRSRMVAGYPDYAFTEKENLLWQFKDGIPVPILTHEILGKHIARHTFIGWKDNNTMIFSRWIPELDKKICPNSDTMHLKVAVRLEKNEWKLHEEHSPEDIQCKHH
jgi:hypothetical protein